MMAIVAGIVSQEDRAHIVQAGYTLADHAAVLPLLKDMQTFGAAEEEAVAVWVDCDVTDLLVFDETLTSSAEPSERTVKVAVDSVRKVAARMGTTLTDNEAEHIAAQVAAHLREAIEDEIRHAINT
jgi:hypothetical protein